MLSRRIYSRAHREREPGNTSVGFRMLATVLNFFFLLLIHLVLNILVRSASNVIGKSRYTRIFWLSEWAQGLLSGLLGRIGIGG
jgi:hypothetical protein